jgi:hypothetical protein
MSINKFKILAFLAVLAFVTSCKTKVAPTSERIKKVWTIKSVTENGTEVFKLGAANNVKPGYSTYKLDLSAPPAVSLRDVDGGTYKGIYSIPTENSLNLSGLAPEPTGTAGKLDFKVVFISATEISLTATTPYPKTGNTTNVYVLTSGI